ncbi:polyamine aminopropyltransferase [Methylophilus sp. YYY-1]|uniref:polyamine aminopropyltransferase n=1 Tax=Methylophilus sp. YYY-1 TaxID=2682087 RepID=UPI0023B2ED84|nr:polyamine aminopropyltransferase [Methylophilus sp. YYY-1]MDF0376727.1 polyamine aminopropyltransferase [Methylophilus sp. YYY-1]
MFKFNRKVHKAVSDFEMVEVTEMDGVRSMHLGSPTIQSSMSVKDPYALVLAYSWGALSSLLFKPAARKLLLVGLGGGSIAKYVWKYCPQIKQTVVELNPQVIQVARSHFFVPDDDARLQIIEGDGIAYLQQHPGSVDWLMMDAFGSNGLPPDFCTQAFFDDCADALTPDGLFTINLWGSDKKFDIYMQRMEQTFDQRVLMMPTGKPGNIIVFGFKAELPIPDLATLRKRSQDAMQTHRINFPDLIDRLQGANPNNGKEFQLGG